MEPGWSATTHRKRKRRRGLNRPAIHAQLLLDERLKGDVCILSEDLYNELFPAFATRKVTADAEPKAAPLAPRYVAIAPRIPSPPPKPDTTAWTVLAVQRFTPAAAKKSLPRNSLYFSSSSPALQTFGENLRKVTIGRSSSGLRPIIDIHILDTVPLVLDTVVVSIDPTALIKLEEAKQQYNYAPHWRGESTSSVGLNSSGERKRRPSGGQEQAPGPSSRWESVVRQALQIPRIVHAGDLLPLPLAAHPITHKPAPPAKITLCSPVSQGLLHQDTRIVITQAKDSSERLSPTVVSFPAINGLVVEEEDSANEQFHSAAEERGGTHFDSSHEKSLDSLTDELSEDDDDNLSDGSGDTVGLSLPTLPTQASGIGSAYTSATPRIGLGQMNGIATPGSILSGFSTTTSRAHRSKGRVFEAHGLTDKVPDSLLLPKPAADDDEESRVYIDTISLVKIGCFSGDWVRVEAATDNRLNTLSAWGLGAFDSAAEESSEWRPARVFALPTLQHQTAPRYALNKSSSRRGSISSVKPESLTPRVCLSPVLLSNLGAPSHLRIASLAQSQALSQFSRGPSKPRITSKSTPPYAKEVTLLKIATPLATERNLQSILLLGLRNYFEQKKRVVRNGDLIAVPIDDSLGKALYQGTATEDDNEHSELLLRNAGHIESPKDTLKNNVAWFRIRSVLADIAKSEQDGGEAVWGGISIVRPGFTGMIQAGTEQSKLPSAMSSSWPYYLGTKRLAPEVGQTLLAQQGKTRKEHISPLRRRLRELVSVATSPHAIHLGLPPLSILLVSTQRHIGKAATAVSACTDLGLHTFTIDAYDILTEGGVGGGDVKTEAFLKARVERALTCGAEYTALLIRHIEVLNADRMVGALKEILADARVLIATTTEVDKVPEGVRGLFTHELELAAHDEAEREGLLSEIIQAASITVSPSVDLSAVAVKTAALVAGDLVDVVERAVVAQGERLESLAEKASQRLEPDEIRVSVRDIQLAGGDASRSVIKADFDVAVDAARKNFADSIGAPKIPNVTWDDVGGLSNIKDAVMETIQLPLERPELFAKGIKKRSGILFYGPPGTGKTLLAKAIATEFSLNFFSIKGPELLNMYIGESEANVRRVFQRARDARPCVVFFDELDSVAPKRGNQGDSGGVMDRIVSQLLAELDGMSSGDDGGGGGVFVIGATNRPDLLDQALLRPGRFDKMLYLGVSETHEGQLTILNALTRKFALHPKLSLSAVADTLPLTYTGADLYALCSDAMLKAITRRSTLVDTKIKAINAQRTTHGQSAISTAYYFDHLSSAEDTAVVVEEEDFAAAQQELVPSVSAKELEHYRRVKSVFEQRDANKDGASANGPGVNGTNGAGAGAGDLAMRTAQLSISSNGNSNGNGAALAGKGKGKARAPAVPDFGFHDSADDGLYE